MAKGVSTPRGKLGSPGISFEPIVQKPRIPPTHHSHIASCSHGGIVSPRRILRGCCYRYSTDVSQVANVAFTVSKAVSSLVHAVKLREIGIRTLRTLGSSSPVSWVFTHGTEIPRGVLGCGADIRGSPLYACRTFDRGGVRESPLLHRCPSPNADLGIDSGKAGRHFKKGAMFGYDGKEHETEVYEVLVADQSAVRWETASYPFYPRTFNGATLVEGGHEHDGSPLFLARAFYWGGTHPGKMSSYLKGADITFAGKEYVVNDFQVLVHNPTSTIQFACIEELD
ncbi:hypothetical protein FRC12_013325 [Ceratobasidium sp. 428]|nr:hypothetical protein FRC12_013325 [Ceratobasidium sp. 428]